MAVTLDHTSLSNILMDAMVDRLVQKLQVDVDDDAKAGLVRSGKLQADPTTKKINILVHTGGEEHPDELNTDDDGNETGMFAPSHTIGAPYGTFFFRRRFQVEYSIFFEREPTRDMARIKAMVAQSRVIHALVTMNLQEIPADSFGEKAILFQIMQNHIFEGGGEGDFNWRGRLIVEFMTEFEPTEF